MNDFKITSNCPLCEQHSLHVIGIDNQETMQCIYCGFASADKFKGEKNDTNEGYKILTDEQKEWSVHENGRVWIPTVMAMPFGMLYPKNIDNNVTHKQEMRWCWAEMVTIQEEDRKNYPDDNGGFYEKRVDVENERILEHFLEGMHHINEMSKAINEMNEPKVSKLNLPKLKKK
jgi:Zn ribbon nucleic-acid-binding protein